MNGTPETYALSRAAFLARATAIGALATGGMVLGTGTASAANTSAPKRGLTYRGINYDVGTEFAPGEPTRSRPTDTQLHREIGAIDEGLHCNLVNVHGTDVTRLVRAATVALRRGLAVVIQPRPFDRPQAYTLDHLARTARRAEQLRRAHRPEVILAIGCEFILFTPGIVPGATFLDRIRFLTEGTYDIEEILKRLRAFVDKAVAVARRHFHGRITYGAAAGLERIDWSKFDIVGLDYYDWYATRREYTEALAPYRRWGKPIMILEFGCCTYEGAAKAGGMGWDIVDYEKEPPEIKPGFVRSEREQAEHLARLLPIFEAEGLLGTSIYNFIGVDSPHSKDPKYDMDMASYGLVKVIRKRYEDPASPYVWKPKEAFHAVARHNRRRLTRTPWHREENGG